MRFRPWLAIATLAPMLALLAACSDDESTPTPPAGDTQKPSVQIVAPLYDAKVNGDSLSVEVTATDNVGVTRVDILLDDHLTADAMLLHAPWNVRLPLTGMAAGLHTVSAKAYDSAGNGSNLSRVTFYIVDQNAFTMQLRDGSVFTYRRWALDLNNAPVAGSDRDYVRTYTKGTTTLGGQTDWYYAIARDMRYNDLDTLIVRTDAANNFFVYGFVNEFAQRLIAEAIANGLPVVMPTLPAPTWDLIGNFNDANGVALQPGVTWNITAGNGIDIPISLVTANMKLTGAFTSRGDEFTVNGKVIRTWQSTVSGKITILGQESVIPIHIWLSNDPNGQIRMQQETSVLRVLTQQYPVAGELQELTNFVE
jgi:hypothetical protein